MLVGGGPDHSVDVRPLELIDADSCLVDGHRHDLEPGPGGDATLLSMARVLECDAPDAIGSEGPADMPWPCE
jgi:hypothetical protein